MAEIKWTVEGRRFRNAEEYQSALRDKKLIDAITGSLDLDNPKDIERLYVELKNGKYTFESIVGRQFDDNIYELYQRIKREERESDLISGSLSLKFFVPSRKRNKNAKC